MTRRIFLSLRRTGLAAVCLCLASRGLSAPGGSGDVFAPWRDAGAPVILREIEAVEAGSATVPGLRVRRVVFASPVAEPANEVYAVIARPVAPGPHPGLLLLHGGKGRANESDATAWARLGYVVVAPDLPGIADPKNAVHSRGAWTERAYADGRWTASPMVESSTIFQGAAAALQVFALLRAQPEADAARLGVTGTSWGGYATTLVCGILGAKVKAGFSNYGSGFYELTVFQGALAKMPAAGRATWLEQLDAGRRAPGIVAPFFIAGAANDTFFYPPAVAQTLAAVTGPAGQLYAPNAHHRLPVPGGTMRTGGSAAMAETWFAWHLQGRGDPFPTVELEPGSAGDSVGFLVTGPRAVTAAVWYSLPAEAGGWPKRQWKEIPATPRPGGGYEARLPAGARRSGAAWFALVSDDRPVSVSSRLVVVDDDALGRRPEASH